MTRPPSVFRELSRHQASRFSSLLVSRSLSLSLSLFVSTVATPRVFQTWYTRSPPRPAFFCIFPSVRHQPSRPGKMHRFIPRERTQIFEAATGPECHEPVGLYR